MKRLRQDLTSARREMDFIDRKVAELGRRRELVSAYLQSAEALLAGLDAEGADGMEGGTAIADLATRRTKDKEATSSLTKARSQRRAFTNEVAKEALHILRDLDRPAGAHEILERHSQRERITAEELYNLLYKRAYEKRYVKLISGRFWPIERETPGATETG